MKKLVFVLAIAGLVFIALPACERGPGEGAGEGKESQLTEGGIPADAVLPSSFDDDVPALRPEQSGCFICGKEPIKQEYHADVTVKGEKKRVYFDSQECKQNFEQNREQWTKGIGER